MVSWSRRRSTAPILSPPGTPDTEPQAACGRYALARIRTWDAGLRRAALYPLSYEGGRSLRYFAAAVLLEPRRLHRRRRVNGDHPQPPWADALEAVRGVGRDDDDLARLRLHKPVAVPEPAAALEHDERLRVRVGVGLGALARARVDNEAGHIRAEVDALPAALRRALLVAPGG